jgi:cell filamentation protein, protein adenylyltransferase
LGKVSLLSYSFVKAIELLGSSKPTANKAIDALCRAAILHEVTGKRRNRVYSYGAYLDVLSEDTDIP